jgi:large subunit ribosomal protein L3
MAKQIVGKKVGMTSIFDEAGNTVPVTVIEAGPCTVTQVKTAEKDGYDAVQVGFGEAKRLAKPQEGHLAKLKIKNAKFKTLREIELQGEEMKVGDKITVDTFNVGDVVAVSGISKGKGFAGTIKRHNFKRGPKTHGSHNYRAPGSIGAGYPEHVFRGQKLPGQMGAEKVTVKNLKVVSLDAEKNLIALRGAVPGPNKSIVLIKG